MSPVTMKLCGPVHAPFSQLLKPCLCGGVLSTCQRTVVSSVFGKAFSKSRARSLSTRLSLIYWITFSTRGDSKVRQYFEGLWNGSSSGPWLYGGLDVVNTSHSVPRGWNILRPHGVLLVVGTCCAILVGVNGIVERFLDYILVAGSRKARAQYSS